jgi:hypothetical protein
LRTFPLFVEGARAFMPPTPARLIQREGAVGRWSRVEAIPEAFIVLRISPDPDRRTAGKTGVKRSMAQTADEAFQTIYANIENGLLVGTSSSNQATVPKGRRLIIEYVSGYIFRPPTADLNASTTMAVTDPALGLNGAGFHVFSAIKRNTTPETDVFAFSAPLKMMLHPKASFYFSDVAGLSVSGYLVKFSGE